MSEEVGSLLKMASTGGIVTAVGSFVEPVEFINGIII